MALVKKGPFLWLFLAIKFQLSLVITFMAFYDCVRTLYIKTIAYTGGITVLATGKHLTIERLCRFYCNCPALFCNIAPWGSTNCLKIDATQQ